MHDWERIALWFIVLVLAVRIFMAPQMSFYTASTPMSIMDLAEFKGLPDDVKQFYQDQVVNKLLPSVSAKVATTWGATSNAQKQATLMLYSNWVDGVIANVNASAPVIS